MRARIPCAAPPPVCPPSCPCPPCPPLERPNHLNRPNARPHPLRGAACCMPALLALPRSAAWPAGGLRHGPGRPVPSPARGGRKLRSPRAGGGGVRCRGGIVGLEIRYGGGPGAGAEVFCRPAAADQLLGHLVPALRARAADAQCLLPSTGRQGLASAGFGR